MSLFFCCIDNRLNKLMLSFLSGLETWQIAIAINTILLVMAVIFPKKLLTPIGLVHAWFLGVLIWTTLNWQGYLVVVFYFLIGSLVTQIGMDKKEAIGIAERRFGVRGPENVWGSAFTAALCALGIGLINWGLIYFPYFSSTLSINYFLTLGYVASLSTKLSDTCASELGKTYGKQTFLITTLQRVPKGTEGAVSLEGTLAGAIASGIISLIACWIGLIDFYGIIWCILAAFIATSLESVIGATLQSQHQWLTNEIVNILNTLIGAITATSLAWLWIRIMV
ncbi:COG1836 [Richelia intracellularis HH01]|uniref:COG1836 n=2 Tax=Richelia TaxID=98443 RepID=M1WZF4_9NOST|nr:COG1836 [Richelia intracellularis HH01]